MTMQPDWLIFHEPHTRRERVTQGRHRQWRIVARYGTADTDRWTLIGTPIPGADNPAACIEDGQFATLNEAREALREAEKIDNGEHEEDN